MIRGKERYSTIQRKVDKNTVLEEYVNNGNLNLNQNTFKIGNLLAIL